MIDSNTIKGTKLDGLHSLGTLLLQYRKEHPDEKLVLFKSDVSQAFRRLPMHPLWQVKQVLTMDGQCYVDWNNNFGGHGSPKVWISFMSLVAWIAIHKAFIDALKLYMDDSFSFEVDGSLLYYSPYQCNFPAKQTHLLQLWDENGVPHDRLKQLYGSPLTVIGFNVDPNAMTATLPLHKKNEPVQHLCQFARKNFQWTLREFQQLAGWCEWSFNIFPLLKPGLLVLYEKICGRTQPFARLHINNAIIAELPVWMANHVERLPGLLFYKSLDFDPRSDDVVIAFTDASGEGLGLWFPQENFVGQSPLPVDGPTDTIFFFKALAVCSAVYFVPDMDDPPSQVLIYTDNTNTIAMFNSLQAHPPYNSILLSTVEVLLQYGVDLQVESTAESLSYMLPSQKNDRLGMGSTILFLSSGVTSFNPLPIFFHYLALRDRAFAYHPALWLTSSGSVPTRYARRWCGCFGNRWDDS